MKTSIIKFSLVLCVSFFTSVSFAQSNNNWEKWSWLIGEWEGEGSGKPGEGKGTFSFNTELDGNVLVRKAHSEYFTSADKPKLIHDDLIYVYKDNTGNANRAIYFDNESHVINYNITHSNDKNEIVFTSEKMTNMPVFRLTYTLIEKDVVNVAFSMSKDGETFNTYVEGKSIKVK